MAIPGYTTIFGLAGKLTDVNTNTPVDIAAVEGYASTIGHYFRYDALSSRNFTAQFKPEMAVDRSGQYGAFVFWVTPGSEYASSSFYAVTFHRSSWENNQRITVGLRMNTVENGVQNPSGLVQQYIITAAPSTPTCNIEVKNNIFTLKVNGGLAITETLAPGGIVGSGIGFMMGSMWSAEGQRWSDVLIKNISSVTKKQYRVM